MVHFTILYQWKNIEICMRFWLGNMSLGWTPDGILHPLKLWWFTQWFVACSAPIHCLKQYKCAMSMTTPINTFFRGFCSKWWLENFVSQIWASVALICWLPFLLTGSLCSMWIHTLFFIRQSDVISHYKPCLRLYKSFLMLICLLHGPFMAWIQPMGDDVAL